MNTRAKNRRGNAMIEFTLVGIPILFTLISVFEITRGMWIYETLAHSIKDAMRFVIVKGQNCSTAPNACAVTVQQIAQRIRDAGVGLDPATFSVTLTSSTRTIGPSTLQTLLGDATYWPTAAPGNPADPGSGTGQVLAISGVIPFRSAISMFWPGAGQGIVFGTYNLGASARERIRF